MVGPAITRTFARFGKPFWIFLFSENLYDFGLYIFVLLYNLYLLDLGFREDFLGWVSSAMTAGNIVGTLPAAFATRRYGLKRTLICASAGVASLCAVRALVLGKFALILSAFAMGLISSMWMVSLVPVVAALTTERDRPLGYSLWTGSGVGLGVLCGALAGALPGRILRAGLAVTDRGSKQIALLFGAVVAFLSPWLLVRLPLGNGSRAEPKLFPRSPFVVRYLATYAVWNFAIGIFNPFFSAYFSRQLHMPVSMIGIVFSGAQLATLAALASAPALLKRVGTVAGISGMQLGMAVSLALLATSPPAIAAGALYASYMSFQVMTEPGLFTLLMSRVEPAERGGASALNFFVMAAPQAAAAAIAGVAVTRFGYQVVLSAAAALAALSAFLFQHLMAQHAAGRGHSAPDPQVGATAEE